MKKRISALFLALLMMLALCATAFAAEATSTDITSEPPPVRVSIEAPGATDSDASSDDSSSVSSPEDADAPAPAELPTSASIRMTTPNQYNMIATGLEYDQDLDCLVLEFKLSDAGKIELLCEYLYPAYQLEEEIAALERLMDGQHFLHDVIYSGQEKPLYEMLSKETRAKLTEEMTLTQIVEVLNGQTDLTEDAAAFGWNYIGSISSTCAKLQQIMEKLYSTQDTAESFYGITVNELLTRAKAEAATENFQQLMTAIKPLLNGNRDAKALHCRFTGEEIGEHYAALAAASKPYWGVYVNWIEEMRFRMYMPVDTFIESVHNLENSIEVAQQVATNSK